MKKIIYIVLLLSSIMFANEDKNGFSVAVNNEGESFRFAYDLNMAIRVELLRYYYYKNNNNTVDSFETTTIGIAIKKQYSKNQILYSGFSFGQQSDENTSGKSLTAINLGFEHFLDSRISLGGELTYYERDIDKSVGTQNSLLLRFYF